MKTELYKAIKAIDIKSLNDDDKEELLKIFMVTKNDLIRNQISFIFADLHYDKAVPYIIKKINEKSTAHNNGSLVFSLQEMNVRKYFTEFIKIICKHGYEARLVAFEIIQKLASSIPNKIRSEALKLLEERRVELERSATDKGENSTLHFVEKTEELLQSFRPST